ncbi:MAG: hypothetical protein HDR12_16180 [Lachnospiraceae bacterium]|nr:hypothetical protein [Lachnospiraceae bacterium]
MKKNGMIKRFLTVLLSVIAAIGLTMQGTSVFAETLSPELQGETTEDRQESQGETLEESESDEQTENEEPELSEEQTETEEEQSVSGNDISEGEAEDPNETIAEPIDEGSGDTNNTLSDEILKNCIVNGMNPQGVTVNLFDYWQDNVPQEELDKGNKEVAHDFCYWVNNVPDYSQSVTTYNLGISREHLLRFGYRSDATDDYCQATIEGKQLGDYGDWNEYVKTSPCQGIVKHILGPDGFPVLNFSGKTDVEFGRYADNANRSSYLTEVKKIESLAYLFSPNVQNKYKASYSSVQGLFQPSANGYYYYDSQKNFASFNEQTNSFILYNSPGVAKEKDDKSGAEFCGQFFPFNTAKNAFDSYIENNDGSYQLTYQDIEKLRENNSDYDPISADGNSYIKCYAPSLNHYFGLTLEMQFVQPAGGRVNGDTGSSDMIFRFSGDDDVWIFIDDVLVADLGGIHDALGLSINFATGDVEVAGEKRTLYDAFVTAYGENSNLGDVEFNGNTFADNTTHTLKMFYLERGHMASNLSLSFNIQPLPSPPDNNEEKEKDYHETEEHTSDSDTNPVVEIPVSDNTLYDIVEIPKTGDDSMIEWWAALCIISLVGIGATVCNLIIRKRKNK